MKTVDVTAEDVEPPDWLPDLSSIAVSALQELNRAEYDVSILLCTNSRIADLNRQYRGAEGPTDVLTFSQSEGDAVPGDRPGGEEMIAGDIVISLESVASNAREFEVPATEEIIRVVVHGLLHLAGHVHDGINLSDNAASENKMLRLQEHIVKELIKEQNQ